MSVGKLWEGIARNLCILGQIGKKKQEKKAGPEEPLVFTCVYVSIEPGT